MDDFIDTIEGNRRYVRCLFVYNKVPCGCCTRLPWLPCPAAALLGTCIKGSSTAWPLLQAACHGQTFTVWLWLGWSGRSCSLPCGRWTCAA